MEATYSARGNRRERGGVAADPRPTESQMGNLWTKPAMRFPPIIAAAAISIDGDAVSDLEGGSLDPLRPNENKDLFFFSRSRSFNKNNIL